MVPYKCCCFSARSAQGLIRAGPKGSRWPLLQQASSLGRKATATNRMHSYGTPLLSYYAANALYGVVISIYLVVKSIYCVVISICDMVISIYDVVM